MIFYECEGNALYREKVVGEQFNLGTNNKLDGSAPVPGEDRKEKRKLPVLYLVV